MEYIDGCQHDSDLVEKLEKAFAKSDKTDAVLVVNGRKLHVNKAILSYHSDYFNTLFNSEFMEKSMEEIEIKEVKYVEFAMLLSQVHDTPVAITRAYAKDLLKLADRFLLHGPKLHVENFIIISPNMGRYEKLILADRYNLENLLKHALGLYTSKESLADLSTSSSKNFSDNLKLKIFNKLFENFDTFFK